MILKQIPGGGGGGRPKYFFLENQFFLISNIEKCPFTYWLNGRWFLKIVDRDSGNLYMWRWFGGGGGVFLTFYAISDI